MKAKSSINSKNFVTFSLNFFQIVSNIHETTFHTFSAAVGQKVLNHGGCSFFPNKNSWH